MLYLCSIPVAWTPFIKESGKAADSCFLLHPCYCTDAFPFPQCNLFTWLQPAKNLVQTLTDRGTSPPVACHICSDEFEEAYNHETSVFHGKSVQAFWACIIASTFICGTSSQVPLYESCVICAAHNMHLLCYMPTTSPAGSAVSVPWTLHQCYCTD